MSLIGKGLPGKQLITHGYGESLGESCVVIVYGVEAISELGSVKVRVAAGASRLPDFIHADVVPVEHERVYGFSGVEAVAELGVVGVRITASTQVKVAPVIAEAILSSVEIKIGASPLIKPVEAIATAGIVAVQAYQNVEIPIEGMEARALTGVIKSVDMRLIEDEEIIGFLLAA